MGLKLPEGQDHAFGVVDVLLDQHVQVDRGLGVAVDDRCHLPYDDEPHVVLCEDPQRAERVKRCAHRRRAPDLTLSTAATARTLSAGDIASITRSRRIWDVSGGAIWIRNSNPQAATIRSTVATRGSTSPRS
ncbi:hypothetical protein BH23ACT9_BH23ACT9_39480 [soil metagenome]